MNKKILLSLMFIALVGVAWAVGFLYWRNESKLQPGIKDNPEDFLYVSKITGVPKKISIYDTSSENFSINIAYNIDGSPICSIEGYDLRLKFDEAKLADMVNSCMDLRAGDFVQQDTDNTVLSNYGLDEPTRVLTITSYDGSSLSVSIGNQITGSNYYFVKNSLSNTIYLVNTNYVAKLLYTLNDLRKPELFPSEETMVAPNISYLSIKNNLSNDKIELDVSKNQADVQYRMNLPVSVDADAKSVYNLLLIPMTEIQNRVKIAKDYPGDLSNYGLDSPEYIVTFTENDISYSLLFSVAVNGKRYIMRSDIPAVLSIDIEDTEFLNTKYMKLISPLFWQSSITDILSIYIETKEKSYNLSVKIDESNLQNASVYSGTLKANPKFIAQIIQYIKNANFEVLDNANIADPMYVFKVSMKGGSLYTFNANKTESGYEVALVDSGKGFYFSDQAFNEMSEQVLSAFYDQD